MQAQPRRAGRALRHACWPRLPLCLPARVAEDRSSAWHLYAVEIDLPARAGHSRRRGVRARCAPRSIGVNVHYIPIHTQPYYRQLGFRRGDFPAAEHYYAGALTLPLFPALTEAQQDEVAASLAAALG